MNQKDPDDLWNDAIEAARLRVLEAANFYRWKNEAVALPLKNVAHEVERLKRRVL